MDIQIDVVRICGFRGVSNVEVILPRVTVLFGQNNAGKTSIIKALQLSLGDYSRYLSDEDFHIGDDEKRQDNIVIDLRFIALDRGIRTSEFSESWQQEFGDSIQAEADGKQFVAIRTTAKPDRIKGGYNVERFYLDVWPNAENWQDLRINSKNKMGRRLESIPFISIDAQRDIHNELKEKSSFVGRVLSSIEYGDDDVAELEKMVAEINKEAINKSEPLKRLKNHLDTLNQSFEGSGQTELTPFPKKIRDLSKRFSVHFGESDKSSFSMEYHGMGTRSWASILAVKAFTELMATNHENEAEPFFPILAAEEPEAHLHPNAQRTLFQQLQDSPGQVIISTHSPYLVGMSELENLRGLIKTSNAINATRLISELDQEDINNLQREIMRFRGELLFSKALILFEGVTEEQIIPSMFSVFFGKSAFSLGVNCISVSGKNYPPFIKMALSFGIPVCIVSDNDGNTKAEIESQLRKIEKNTSLILSEKSLHVSYLSPSNDIEAELIHVVGMRQEIIEALINTETRGRSHAAYIEAKTREIEGLTDDEILRRMRSSKASYAGFLADVILRNPNNKTVEQLIPQAVIDTFTQLKEWG
ncbi:TPA: AAA family ATPase [Morganella morganii]|uniref:ATP-dependent nuclease n=1 Tax=Morganella morganii TaxID=582 RepID=UPI000B41B669|nr:AAA family ATPase [Morganella morganii]EKW7746683.1 AAA family ATPase [Morganella morganii]ELB1545247.1 AAA family ATPase [Morganella morganii]MBT0313829.1 AAA family ATPase [Morganella morganii subsp. morganii]MBT0464156.1 AAA family ATPase [Morganella morganii subsp. morganii]MBT0468711.1 AAA family ATPase [Morganella morganii subsp. morganii]